MAQRARSHCMRGFWENFEAIFGSALRKAVWFGSDVD